MPTYRMLSRWGDPRHQASLDQSTREALREIFDLKPGEKRVPETAQMQVEAPGPGLSKELIGALEAIVGEKNIDLSAATRVRKSSGASYHDALRLWLAAPPHLPDAVLYPRDDTDVAKLIALCGEHRVPLLPVGGSTSVTGATEFPGGGLCLDLRKHMNRIIRVSAEDLTVTVETGAVGPDFERELQCRGFTCGHFPQSFEFSTVGGWIGARGAGQQSTYYGKIEDMLLGMRVLTPSGTFDLPTYHRASMGPDWRHLFLGSEGSLGVITQATLRIWPKRQRQLFSFFLPNWERGVNLVRCVLQGEFGLPGVFRLSDPEETELGLRLNGMAETTTDRWLCRLGYRPGKRCLMIGSAEGDRQSRLLVTAKVHAMALARGAIPLGSSPAKKWWNDRYHHPYLRDELMGMGLIVDTLETCAPWSRLLQLREGVRATLKSRPKTAALCHISHAYSSGANLYFIFMSRLAEQSPLADFRSFHREVVSAIVENGGALSHHHGVGRLFAPWYRDKVGPRSHDLLKAVKGHLDPDGVLNPGALEL